MPKLYSNPWKESNKLTYIIKYRLRILFYKWLLKKYCRGCKTVLEVGCAQGHFMKAAEELGLKATGVELDERFKKKNVIIKNVYDIKGKYDVVFSNRVIEGMDHEKFVKKNTELSNNIVITIGTYLSRNFWNTPDFKFPVTKIRLRWLFRRYGFRNLLSIHIPFWKAVVVVSKRVTNKDTDLEARRLREGFW